MSKPEKPYTPTYSEFKLMIPNKHKYSRKELRKAYRDYLKYAKKETK